MTSVASSLKLAIKGTRIAPETPLIDLAGKIRIDRKGGMWIVTVK